MCGVVCLSLVFSPPQKKEHQNILHFHGIAFHNISLPTRRISPGYVVVVSPQYPRLGVSLKKAGPWNPLLLRVGVPVREVVDTSHDGLKKIQSQLSDSLGCKGCVLQTFQTPPLRHIEVFCWRFHGKPWKVSHKFGFLHKLVFLLPVFVEKKHYVCWWNFQGGLVPICARVESSVWRGMVISPEKWLESLFNWYIKPLRNWVDHVDHHPLLWSEIRTVNELRCESLLGFVND